MKEWVVFEKLSLKMKKNLNTVLKIDSVKNLNVYKFV